MRRLRMSLLLALLAVGNGAPPKAGSECGGPAGKPCEDLNKCSPPTERLSVPDEVVLVMGNTGCGKSTLTKHLSRHDEDMKAVLDGADFLINGSRIGSSIASVTQVPDLMTNKKDGIHYFDCPGFEDTRGSCVEVSTTYYMKDIVRHARRVKVLLLTPHFAVQRGQDRSDLLMMLKNAAQIFRNVAAVKDSLALVVTKVSGYVQVGDEWEPTPEDDVKAATADFLREDVLPFLKNMARSGEDRDLYSRAAEIINVLITKENGAYTRLGVFRSPDEEGSLRELDLMERGRDSLLELVKHNIKYSRVQPADFGFAVSDRTKVFAYKRARELSSEIVSKLSALGAAIQAGRTREARVAADVPAREARFTEAAQRVRGVAAHLKQSAGVQEFCGRVVDQMVQPEERSRAVEVAATCQQLDVLQVVGDKPLVDAATLGVQWVQPVQDAAAVLEAHRDWQRFLVAIHDRLNKYDALQPRKANVRHPPVGAHNAHHFELEVVKLGVATDLKSPFANLTELNALLEMASQGPSFECLPGGRVVVRGESVLLSEAAAAARTTCPGSMPLRVLEVYATYTVFVDVDVTLPGVHLVVVAPRLEAVGHPTVSLDGLPGPRPPGVPREAGRGGLRGTDGRPGLPGLPGGSFLAVVAEVVGKISVTANGGRGGDGQRGGNGGPGASGGGDGGRGGDGGAGGFGGSRGRVLVVPVGGSPVNIRVSALPGKEGSGGRGGLGGDRRAATGPRRKRAIGLFILGGIAIVGAVAGAVALANKGQDEPPPPLPTYNNGSPGNDGVVTAGRETPAAAAPVPWAAVPARTQAYLSLHLAHQYRSKEIKQFMEQLAANKAFQALANS